MAIKSTYEKMRFVDALIALVNEYASVNEVYEDDDIIKYIRNNCSVDDVYDYDQLAEWAESHGYKKRKGR